MSNRRTPKVYELTVAASSTYGGANLHSFTRELSFTQIDNLSGTTANVRLNGDSAATFTLAAHTSYIFNKSDMNITSIDFSNNASGASSQAIQLIVGL